MSAEWITRMSEARVVDVAGELGGFEVREAGASWSLSPCPLCDAETRRTANHKDRRGPLGSSKSKPAGWRCHICQEKGDALHLVAIVRERGRRWNELDDAGKARVREWCERFLGLSGDRKPYAPPPIVKVEYPPPGELRDLWALCEPVTKLLDVAAALALRHLDPDLCARQDVVRALPEDAACPAWAGYGARSWAETGHRLIFPLYDHKGVMRSVLARRTAAGDDANAKKSLAPQGFGRSGLVVASATAREWLADSSSRLDKLLITEGEIDLLTWATELTLMPLVCIGIFSGSWSPDFVKRLARDVELVLATDNDAGGEKYANDIRATLPKGARVARWRLDGINDANEARQYGLALELPELPEAAGVPSHLLEEPLPDEDTSAPDAWESALTLNSRGKLESTLGNCITILQNDEPWRGCIAYNERSDRIVWLKCPPIPELDAQGPYPRQLRDSDEVWIAKGLERRWTDFGLRDVHAALMAIARLRAFDPVKDYLDGLKWDGKGRLDTWLERLAGADSTDYVRAVAAKWLISAVARVYEPGCQVDHVLVLEGVQGRGKSSLMLALCDRIEWFCDQLPDIRQRVAAAEILQGPWIVELAELDATQKADASTVKAFISARVDKYRPAYGRNVVDHPRRSVFVATTNEGAYLKDASGGRRFWTVATHDLDVEGARAERAQLWAEAVCRYQGGEAWHFDRAELVDAAREQQDARYTEDPWEPLIRDHLARLMLSLPHDRTPRVTVEECLGRIGLQRADWSDREAKRVVNILTVRLGWHQVQRRDGVGNARRRAYEPRHVRHGGGPRDGGGDGPKGSNGDGGAGGVTPGSGSDVTGAKGDRGDAGIVNDHEASHSLSPPSLPEESSKDFSKDHEDRDLYARGRARARGDRPDDQGVQASTSWNAQGSLSPDHDDDWDPDDYADPVEA